MKVFFYSAIFCLLSVSTRAQFVLVNNFTGTSVYSGVGVTVTSSGLIGTYGAGWCTATWGNTYMEGISWSGIPTPGTYTFTFSVPIYQVKVWSYALNGGPFTAAEYISTTINGAFHNITAAEMTNYNDCGSGGGPVYLNGGMIWGPLGTSADYSGGDFIISECGGINSFSLTCNDIEGGIAYYVWINPTFTGCFSATNNGPLCFGDTLKLTAVGGDSTVPYTWHGPGGFTSTVRNPIVPNATFADTGWFFVVQTVGTTNDTAWTHVVVNGCLAATNNSAICYGQTLTLTAIGGDTLIPYNWYSSIGLIATGKNAVIPSATFVDSGMVCVVQILGGVGDTAWTHVIIKPIPAVTASSNSPLCVGSGNTLYLYATPPYVGETFSWTGPALFTSTLQNPVLTGFVAPDTGWYKVFVTLNGCSDSSYTHVVLENPPPAPVITGDTLYCNGAAFIPFTVTGEPGASFLWYNGGTGGTGSTTPTTVNTAVTGSVTVWVSQVVAGCESTRDSITVRVLPPIVPSFTYTIHKGCNGDTVIFTNTSTDAISYLWNFGDGNSSTSPSPMHVYATSYDYSTTFNGTVTLTASNVLCSLPYSLPVDTRHPLHAYYSLAPDTVCINQAINFNSTSVGTGLSYLWYFGDGNTASSATSATHTYTSGGLFRTQMLITDALTCQDSAFIDVFVITVGIKNLRDTTLCLGLPLLINSTEVSNVGSPNYQYSWTPAIGLNSTTLQAPTFNDIGTFTYTLNVTVYPPLNCLATDSVTINSVLGAVLTNVTPNETVKFGTTTQLNADNEVIYYWQPNDGTLTNPNINNPLATPSVTTTYTVYGRDKYGCLDSAFVTITIDSTMTESIPSAFSPNGDGLNDVFRPVGITFQHLVEFRVFNRWGQELFYSNSVEKGWDGTFNGVAQDIGVYFYEVSVSRPNQSGNVVYKGEVTLLR